MYKYVTWRGAVAMRLDSEVYRMVILRNSFKIEFDYQK